MTKEEAIKYLHKLYMKAEITDEYGDMDDTETYEIAVNMAVEALERTRWIPVSERLPEDDNVVLVTFADGQRGMSIYLRDLDKFISGLTVVAWMPLPEPYNGVEE